MVAREDDLDLVLALGILLRLESALTGAKKRGSAVSSRVTIAQAAVAPCQQISGITIASAKRPERGHSAAAATVGKRIMPSRTALPPIGEATNSLPVRKTT